MIVILIRPLFPKAGVFTAIFTKVFVFTVRKGEWSKNSTLQKLLKHSPRGITPGKQENPVQKSHLYRSLFYEKRDCNTKT